MNLAELLFGKLKLLVLMKIKKVNKQRKKLLKKQ